MSTATAAAPVDAAPPPKKGKKKLFIMIGAAVLVLALAAGAAVIYLKSRAAAAEAAASEEVDDGTAPAAAHAKTHKRDPKAMPTFVPLDPFTVNLADRDAERYAQVGVSLELADAHETDRIKTYMPVIRNNILMVLAHKTSAELLERDGKTKLAHEIQLETARALGVDFGDDAAADEAAATKPGDEDPAAKAKKKKLKKAEPELPVTAVHFSNFIIQ